MQTMTFAQFFNEPAVDPGLQNIYDNINQVQQMINETQKTIDYNNQILHSNPVQDFIQRGQYHAPQNTPNQAIFSSDYWGNMIADAIKKAVWLIWCTFVDISRTLSFMGCIIGIMMWTTGFEKGKQITIGSLLFYIIVKLINMAMGG